MHYNLATLPATEQQTLQIAKQAAHLAWQEQEGLLTAEQVTEQIAHFTAAERDLFQHQLCYYRRLHAALPVKRLLH